ncbi:MAG: hypothetical protein KatS3mg059_0712 [Thermomicrobiales bacterium]|nr:MAG: hypothetical protein KatS3mg059_0712 [Thermomicrobiales bacterium]
MIHKERKKGDICTRRPANVARGGKGKTSTCGGSDWVLRWPHVPGAVPKLGGVPSSVISAMKKC